MINMFSNTHSLPDDLKKQIQSILDYVAGLTTEDKISAINEIRELIHKISPFANEPVDFVRWVQSERIVANDYNPNKVAPPEMELLEISILNDGYTQPIVTWNNPDKMAIEVIDGFHRNRVGKESKPVKERIMGYLPVVDVRKEQSGKNDRIASTIRHNRARGKHQVDAMSEIVIELKNRNWTNQRISKQLGMDEEEVLRLCQISGLENLFTDTDFSKAWVSDENDETYEPISDNLTPEEIEQHRIPNEGDTQRIFHTYDKWECYKAGFYESTVDGMNHEECEQAYVDVLTDLELFESILKKVTTEWKYSCEHYLTNRFMNRIAWLGQASVCYHTGVPSRYSSAWFKLSKEQQDKANHMAHKYLNIWLDNNKIEQTTIDEAMIIGRQMELY